MPTPDHPQSSTASSAFAAVATPLAEFELRSGARFIFELLTWPNSNAARRTLSITRVAAGRHPAVIHVPAAVGRQFVAVINRWLAIVDGEASGSPAASNARPTPTSRDREAIVDAQLARLAGGR
ncbi:MAG TPA: hypothetical protein VGM06_10525 [Polyangiaceae bacterium]|jgi:hypothetical protein